MNYSPHLQTGDVAIVQFPDGQEQCYFGVDDQGNYVQTAEQRAQQMIVRALARHPIVRKATIDEAAAFWKEVSSRQMKAN